MNKKDATALAETYISELNSKNSNLPEDERFIIEINHKETRNIDIGYVFFYNTLEYWRTRDPLTALAGNGPILVTKNGGDLYILPSNRSLESSLSIYRDTLMK